MRRHRGLILLILSLILLCGLMLNSCTQSRKMDSISFTKSSDEEQLKYKIESFKKLDGNVLWKGYDIGTLYYSDGTEASIRISIYGDFFEVLEGDDKGKVFEYSLNNVEIRTAG